MTTPQGHDITESSNMVSELHPTDIIPVYIAARGGGAAYGGILFGRLSSAIPGIQDGVVVSGSLDTATGRLTITRSVGDPVVIPGFSIAASWADTGSTLVAGAGVSITEDNNGNYVISLSTAPPPAQTENLFLSISPDANAHTFAAADFSAAGRSASASSGRTLTVPAYTGGDYRFLAVAYPADKRVSVLNITTPDGQSALGGNACLLYTSPSPRD